MVVHSQSYTRRSSPLPTLSFEVGICDLCAIQHKYQELVDAAIRRRYPTWRHGGKFLIDHPVWDLHQRLMAKYEVPCLTVTDHDGVEVASLCKVHLAESLDSL